MIVHQELAGILTKKKKGQIYCACSAQSASVSCPCSLRTLVMPFFYLQQAECGIEHLVICWKKVFLIYKRTGRALISLTKVNMHRRVFHRLKILPPNHASDPAHLLASEGIPRYPGQVNPYVAFISDIGAFRLQPLFI